MRITLEFDHSLKPLLSRMLSPTLNRMRKPSKTLLKHGGRTEYLAAYSLLTQLDMELNDSKGDNVTLRPR